MQPLSQRLKHSMNRQYLRSVKRRYCRREGRGWRQGQERSGLCWPLDAWPMRHPHAFSPPRMQSAQSADTNDRLQMLREQQARWMRERQAELDRESVVGPRMLLLPPQQQLDRAQGSGGRVLLQPQAADDVRHAGSNSIRPEQVRQVVLGRVCAAKPFPWCGALDSGVAQHVCVTWHLASGH
jgi:hypothetical protein